MRCFLQLVSDFTVYDTKRRVFTESYTEQHFVTLMSSISFFLAVTWAVCVCMDRRVCCWQLLISDCKVLIMRAADLFLKSTTSNTLLEGEIKHVQQYYASKIIIVITQSNTFIQETSSLLEKSWIFKIKEIPNIF